MEKVKIVKIGQCDKCGQVIIRPFECSHGVCDKHNAPTTVHLEPVIVVAKDYYLRLIALANQANVSLEKLVDVLSNMTYEELYANGLLNLTGVKH
jgi:hypothetical protein